MPPGTLTIIATPIGNLDDFAPRAIKTLADADLILCEDSRRLAILKQRFHFDTPSRVLADYNEDKQVSSIIDNIIAGKSVVLVSDGGTPLISDPGYKLVVAAIDANITIDSVPGANAPVNAIILSGLPPYPFAFLGFIPSKSGDISHWLKQHNALQMTRVLFSTPHRVVDDLLVIEDTWGDLNAALCREMTKLHQEVIRGTLSEIRSKLRSRDRIKGEITLVIAGAQVDTDKDTENALALARKLKSSGVAAKTAAKIAAEEYNVRKNIVYQTLIKEIQ